MSAALWSLINARRGVLRDRSDAMVELGLFDAVWAAALLEEMKLLASLARQLHADHFADRPTSDAPVALRAMAYAVTGAIDRGDLETAEAAALAVVDEIREARR